MSPGTCNRPIVAIARYRCAIRESRLGFVANRLDVVAVRTDDEGCVVVRVVVRAHTGRTIVFATRLQRGAVESVDLLASRGNEREVKMRRLLIGLVQAQGNATRRAELDPVSR